MACEKYKKGFLIQNFAILTPEILNQLRLCKEKCEFLTVGLPTDEFYLRMTEKWPDEGTNNWIKKRDLLQSQVVDEVINIDIDNLSVRNNYEQVKYDVYFFGQEYGKQYQKDKRFLEEQNVEMISIQPDSLTPYSEESGLWSALHNASYDRKIVLFGTGRYFDFYMQNYGKQFPPVYAIDNNPEKWNTNKQGILIHSPEILKDEKPENVFIILCCRDYNEIINQILKIGDFDYRSLRYNQSLAIMEEYRVIRQEEDDYIEKAHRILMIMMREFDRVCTELGLRYYVISGSLIGVVRHQGLIPWDDDIDVAMSHHDYMILKEKAKDIWKDKEFLFLDYDQIGKNIFYDFMTRIVYLKEEISTGLFRKVKGKAREDIMNRMVLDIYVLEDTIPGMQHKVITMLLKGIYALAMGHRGYIDYSDYEKLSKLAQCGLRIATGIGKIIPLKFIFKLYEAFRGYAKHKNANHCFESNGVINYMPWIYDKKLYGDGTRLPMNDVDVMVPVDYHGLLKAKGYGNYMEYPGVTHRKPSHMAKACDVIW